MRRGSAMFMAGQSDHQCSWHGLSASTARGNQCDVIFGGISARHSFFLVTQTHGSSLTRNNGKNSCARLSSGLRWACVGGRASRDRSKAGGDNDAGSGTSNRLSTCPVSFILCLARNSNGRAHSEILQVTSRYRTERSVQGQIISPPS